MQNRKPRPGPGRNTHASAGSRIDPREAWLVAALLALAALGWIITARQMAGMDMGHWTNPGPIGLFLATWVVMLAAMMFPSVAPMVIAYARIQRHRRETGRPAPSGSTTVFVAGYLLAGTIFGLAAYTLYAAAVSFFAGLITSDPGGRFLAAGVILAAAAYQFTPTKNLALMKCRTPMDFILRRIRPGYNGALRMGIEHGAWCITCCWALMIALFALGMMNIGWMALVGAFIAAEKMLPWKTPANRGIAIVLTVIAAIVALPPGPMAGMSP